MRDLLAAAGPLWAALALLGAAGCHRHPNALIAFVFELSSVFVFLISAKMAMFKLTMTCILVSACAFMALVKRSIPQVVQSLCQAGL